MTILHLISRMPDVANMIFDSLLNYAKCNDILLFNYKDKDNIVFIPKNSTFESLAMEMDLKI